MDLCEVIISGYRRFAQPVRLKTSGKLVAILGPNEAGKTSLLAAIEHLDNDGVPKKEDLARSKSAAPFSITGRFFLDASDLKEAKLSEPHWFVIAKGSDGVRRYSLEPPAPQRDLRVRHKLAAALRSAAENGKFAAKLEGGDIDIDDLRSMAEALDSKVETLSQDVLSRLEVVGSRLEAVINERDNRRIRAIPDDIKECLAVEREPTPGDFALKALGQRIPQFVRFNDDARNLQSSYPLEEVVKTVPVALDNLCDVAGIKGKELARAGLENDLNTLSTLEGRANRQLASAFKQAWQQSGVSVSIRVQDSQLVIQAVDESHEYTSFEERSDGLRQFIALQAFASGNWRDPVLLIDEAEQRLHYDAQADLVQMLARQTVASKVIYTTHSAGCLPEDLGNGVRLACPADASPSTSEIKNKFWAGDARGLMPLLFGMGASTLAYFPTRRAVMVEGISDMLLLPTMFKQALDVRTLGFQFVPGLAENGKDGVAFQPPVIGAGNGVLYLVDGDSAGTKMKSQLVARRVSERDIFTLAIRRGQACELEDFIAPNLLVEATETYRQKFYPQSASVANARLPAQGRMAALEATFKQATDNKLPKVELAYEVLDKLYENPNRGILDPQRLKAFRSIAASVVARFSAVADERHASA